MAEALYAVSCILFGAFCLAITATGLALIARATIWALDRLMDY